MEGNTKNDMPSVLMAQMPLMHAVILHAHASHALQVAMRYRDAVTLEGFIRCCTHELHLQQWYPLKRVPQTPDAN